MCVCVFAAAATTPIGDAITFHISRRSDEWLLITPITPSVTPPPSDICHQKILIRFCVCLPYSVLCERDNFVILPCGFSRKLIRLNRFCWSPAIVVFGM